jgi:hypothetical protein
MAITRMDTTALAKALPDIWVEKIFVEVLRNSLVVYRLGKPSTLVEQAGKKVRWNFFNDPTAITTALGTEGGDQANSTNFSLTSPEATLAEYSGVTEFSKVLLKTAVSGTMEEIIEGLGSQAALSVDTLALTEVANTTVSVNAGAAMTADALRAAVAKALTNKAKPHPSSPGGRFYCFVGSVEACYDMLGEGAPTWSQVKNDQVESAFMTPFDDTPATAAIYGAIVKISTNIQRDTAPTPDDDLNYLFCKDGFGVASLDTETTDPAVIVTMPQERVDVFARNRGHAAWWLYLAFKLIDSNRLIQVKSDATGT